MVSRGALALKPTSSRIIHRHPLSNTLVNFAKHILKALEYHHVAQQCI